MKNAKKMIFQEKKQTQELFNCALSGKCREKEWHSASSLSFFKVRFNYMYSEAVSLFIGSLFLSCLLSIYPVVQLRNVPPKECTLSQSHGLHAGKICQKLRDLVTSIPSDPA